MPSTASAPSTSRSGGLGAAIAARIARAALAGSPGWLPFPAVRYARVGPTVAAYSYIGVD